MVSKRDFTRKRLGVAIARAAGLVVSRAVPGSWRWFRGRAVPALRQGYAGLPHKPVVLAVGAAALAVAVLSSKLPGPSGSGPESHAASGGPIQTAQRETRWVDRLLSDDWQDQKDVTRELLAALGVSLLDDSALLPEGAGLFVSSPELLMLAMDGARKASASRLSLADLAFMLRDFGLPFPEDQTPPRVLESALREWTRAALNDASISGGSSARFLHAMAARQAQPLDLASENWTAEQHRLTHLELFAFFAAFADASPGAAQQLAARPTRLPGARLLTASVGRLLDATIPLAQAADARSTQCSPLADHYEQSGKPLDFEQNNKTMEGIIGALGAALGEGGKAAAAAAKILEALNLAFKLQKLVLLYSSLDMRLTADQGFVHKPHPGEADKEVIFNVTVGLDDEKYREFVEKLNSSESGKALKDCLASAGLPAPSDMTDILGEMKDWDVVWRLNGGNSIFTMFSTGHASWDPGKNGFEGSGLSRERLSPVDETHVGADFIVDIAREEQEERGETASATISAEATLHTDSAMPGSEVAAALQASWKTLLEGEFAGAGGLLGTVVGALGTTGAEVASGWARRLWDPEVMHNVSVAYHRPGYTEYTYEGTVSADFSYSRQREQRGRRDEDGEYQDYFQNRQSQGRLVATNLRTVNVIPWHRNEGVDIWEIAGEAQLSGSYSINDLADALDGCAGAMLQRRREVQETRGSGSHAVSTPYAVQIVHRADRMGNGRHVLHLHLRNAGIGVPYSETRSDRGEAGCEFSSRDGWNRTSHEQKVATMGAQKLDHSISLAEPYPETIAGERTVTETYGPDDVSSTTWKWNFRRIDPIED